MEERVEKAAVDDFETVDKAASTNAVESKSVKPELTEKQKAKLADKARRRAAWEAREKLKNERANEEGQKKLAKQQTECNLTEVLSNACQVNLVAEVSASADICSDDTRPYGFQHKRLQKNSESRAPRSQQDRFQTNSGNHFRSEGLQYHPLRLKAGKAAPTPAQVFIPSAHGWGQGFLDKPPKMQHRSISNEELNNGQNIKKVKEKLFIVENI